MKSLLLKTKHDFSSAIKTSVLIATVAVAFNLVNIHNLYAKEKSLYQIEAELIYNFIQHVEWPSEHNSTTRRVCIMDDSPVLSYFNTLIKNNNDDKIAVVRKYENDYLEDCHVIFINEHYEGYLRRLLFRVQNKPILTIGDIDSFAKNGGIVQFLYRNERVEIVINSQHLKSSQLKIDHDIISISKIVY